MLTRRTNEEGRLPFLPLWPSEDDEPEDPEPVEVPFERAGVVMPEEKGES